MKKLFWLFILGVIVVFVVCLYERETQQAQARPVPVTTDSFKPCFSMALEPPLDPQSRIHRSGAGVGPIPRSVGDFYSQPLISVDPQIEGTGARSLARAVASKGAIWRQADTVTKETGNRLILKVHFLDGSAEERARVKRIAPEWSKHANIRFKFEQSGKSDIRIGFDPNGGHWSHIGKNAMFVPSHERTMNLALRGERYPDSTILHEFGHALGLKHEHQNPALRIKWNENAIIQELKKSQGWNEKKIRHNVINRLDATQTNFTTFDRSSIMLYAIPNRWTIGNFETGYNTTLSATDKQFIAKLYPNTAPVKPITVPTGPTARILKVWVEHNQNQNGQAGMRIHTKFKVNRFKGKPGIACAYFYFRDGKPLKDLNKRYLTQDGKVAVGWFFQPGYVNTIYEDYTLFMPYSELHMAEGRHELKFMVQIFNRSTAKPLGQPADWVYFWVK